MSVSLCGLRSRSLDVSMGNCVVAPIGIYANRTQLTSVGLMWSIVAQPTQTNRNNNDTTIFILLMLLPVIFAREMFLQKYEIIEYKIYDITKKPRPRARFFV